MTLRQEIDAASSDPLIRSRQNDLMRAIKEDPTNAYDPVWAGFPYQRKEIDNLAVVYARRYPRAGIEWIFDFNDKSYSHNLMTGFVMELQESKPGLAMQLLEQVKSAERKAIFARILAHHAKAEDVEPLWSFLLDPTKQVGIEPELYEIKRSLIGAEAGINPDSAWARYHTHLPGPHDEQDFIEICGQLRPGTAFPVRFLDSILAKGQDVSSSVGSAIWRCEHPENIASIEAWLEQDNPGFDPKPSFLQMKEWWLHRGMDAGAADYWQSRAR